MKINPKENAARIAAERNTHGLTERKSGIPLFPHGMLLRFPICRLLSGFRSSIQYSGRENKKVVF